MGAPAYAHVYTHTYSRTHSIVFLSDNLRNTLREVIREHGLSPDRLMQDWGRSSAAFGPGSRQAI